LKVKPKISWIVPYLYILPALIAFMVFIYWPLIYSILLSFYEWNFVSPAKHFVGFDNYTGLVSREFFWVSLWNTLEYTLGLLFFELLFPVGLAVLALSITPQKIQGIFKRLIFTPAVLPIAIVSWVWLWLFNPLGGLLNYFLSIINVSPISWLSDKNWALWSIVLLSGWRQFGYSLILFIAALANIPSEYLESAQLDGANSWQAFWKVSWPLISPTTFFVLIITVIYASTHSFTPINILTQGGPHNSSANLIYFIYTSAFEFFDIGLASVATIIVYAIFMLLTIVQVKYIERYVHYA